MIYMPRCQALLEVPTMASAGEAAEQARSEKTYSIDLRVQRASLTINDHNAADELELTVAWQDAGVDPRTMNSAVVQFYMADCASSGGNLIPSADNLRFVGISTDHSRSLSPDNKTVKFKFLDYTTLFLRMKPFPDEGVPDYSQNLDDAWKRICDNTGYYDMDSGTILPAAANLRDSLVLKGNLATGGDRLNAAQQAAFGSGVYPTIGSAVSSRLRGTGKIPVKPQSSAWDVWQHAVGMCGLISYIDRDTVILADATNYYTSENPPRMVWGRNILTLDESRNTNVAGKRVMLSSYDPLTNTTIEAFYPPRDSRGPKPIKKPIAKKTKGKGAGAPALVAVSEYELLPYPYGVTDPKVLEACARRVYEERSRQELVGKLTTVEMKVARTNDTSVTADPSFDLLTLHAGDVIRVEFESDTRAALDALGSDDERVRYLTQRAGYSNDVAQLMVANMSSFGRMPPNFHVKSVRSTLEFTSDSGSYDTEIEFLNRIQEDGGAISS